MISDWDIYTEITEKMTKEYGFKKIHYKQKFKFESTNVDIIPFGGISQDGYYVWPPDGSPRLPVKGFQEAFNIGITLIFDTLKFKVLCLFGIFITKLITWNDRKEAKRLIAVSFLFSLAKHKQLLGIFLLI